MLGEIIRKEIMDNISQMKFVVTFAVVTVLIISGLAIGAKDYLDKVGESEMQPKRNQESLEVQPDWISAGYIGIAEAKRPYILSIFDHGIDNSLGRTAEVTLGLDTTLDKSRNLMAPILALFGEVDLSFIVKIILSLFVILLTYDAISGEKELGTLKLTLANEVRRSHFILGKILGGFSVIAVAFILPVLLGFAFLMGFYPQILAEFDGTAWIRFGLMMLAYLLYLGLFFAVGLMVSALSHRSANSFIVLLMIWVLFVTIIPRLSLTAGERITPYESYASLQTKAAKEIAEHRGEMMEAFQDQARWVKAIQEGRMAAMFAEIFESMGQQSQEIMAKYEKEYDRQQRHQIATAENPARSLSPTSALTLAVQNLAGSGYERQEEYIDQLRAHQKNFRDYVYKKIAAEKIENPANFYSEMFLNESLDVSQTDVAFTFNEEPLDTVVGRTLMDFAALVIMALIFFAAAVVAFMRYDVR